MPGGMKGAGESPLVSVIVPVYNVEPFLRQCLQSVLDQTYPNWELILVDDGSTDQSGEICEQYKAKDSRVSVFHTANRGVSHARNFGLDHAAGEWISFLDSDDFVSPRALEVFLRHSEGVDVVASSIKGFPEPKTYPSLSAMGNDFVPFFLFDHSTCWNKLYRKERLTARFDERLRHYEDLYFFFDQLRLCDGIRLIPDQLYYYRRNHYQSLTHRFSSQGVVAGKDAYHYVLSIFPDDQALHLFGLRSFVANTTCDCVMSLCACGIDPRIKPVLLEELISDPIFEEAREKGIVPYCVLYTNIWDRILRHDAAGALACARKLEDAVAGDVSIVRYE